MPSRSRQEWITIRSRSLDEILAAHQGLGGTGRGRRFATQQVNYAYGVLLSSQFQGFCRDLHSESVELLVQGINSTTLRSACNEAFTRGRKLDFGNPNPGNIGNDFNLMGVAFWTKVIALSPLNTARRNRLEDLNLWRNAIAHQDFSKTPGGSKLRLAQVAVWRRTCNHLVRAFDRVMQAHIGSVTGIAPW